MAVQREGSFEAAGKHLGMSAIGAAKRIRKLEERMGVPLVLAKPTRPTDAGAALCQYISEVMELEDQLLEVGRASGLQPVCDTVRLKVAVNSENLFCWFLKVLQTHADDKSPLPLFDIILVDQDHSTEFMNNGVFAP